MACGVGVGGWGLGSPLLPRRPSLCERQPKPKHLGGILEQTEAPLDFADNLSDPKPRRTPLGQPEDDVNQGWAGGKGLRDPSVMRGGSRGSWGADAAL